jgi:iron complex outermembrane receptor protein
LRRFIFVHIHPSVRSLCLVFGLVFGLGIAPSFAQNSDPVELGDPWAGVEEMIVSGGGAQILTKVDTAAAIGFDAEILQAEGVSDIGDLAAFTPNLNIKTAFAAVNPTIFIRGVGLDDFNSNSSSAVAILQDGIYMNSPAGQLFGLFDVEGIEVLRGPAPLINNASAGAILIRSNKPKDEFEASLVSTFGNYDLRQFEGVINVPVIPERLAFRGAFKIQERGGITKNRCPGIVNATADIPVPITRNRARGQCRFARGQEIIPARDEPVGPNNFGKDWVNDQDNWAARGLVSYRMPLPNDQEVDWLLSLNGGQNKSLAAQYQHTAMGATRVRNPDGSVRDDYYSVSPATGNLPSDAFTYRQVETRSDNFEGEYDRVGPERLDLLGISLKGDWSASEMLEISSLSGYFWHDRETFANDDAGPKSWLNNDYTDDAWQFTHETTATWLWSEENDMTVGGFFLIEELDGNNIFRNNRSINNPSFTQDFEQDSLQWALYARTHFELLPLPGWGEFTENFSIDASIRYNWAQKQLNNRAVRAAGTGDLANQNSVVSNVGIAKDSWASWTGDAVLTYEFTEEVSVYFKYSRGWKPGHFNANNLNSLNPVGSVNPETVDSIEGALRADWFDGRLKTNVTAFTYDYQDLQVFQVTTDSSTAPLRRLINSEEAEIWGVEWEVTAEPIERLILNFSGGYLNSEYTDFKTSFERREFNPGAGGIRIITVEADYSGNRLIASPEWSLTGSVQYTVASRLGDFTPRFSFSYSDDTLFDANEGCGAEGNVPECLLKQPSLWIFNTTLKYVIPSGQIEVLAFVRNFLDEEYKVQSFDNTSNGFLIDVYGDPRTFGAAITFRFD